jgi:hypothetical protein
MAKTFKINGRDYTKYFAHRNWTLEYQPVNGNNAGLMLDGSYTEDEIAIKAVITLSLMPLNETQAATLLDDVLSTTYPVLYYYDLRTGAYREIETLRKVSASTYWGGCYGGDYWGNSQITFTER